MKITNSLLTRWNKLIVISILWFAWISQITMGVRAKEQKRYLCSKSFSTLTKIQIKIRSTLACMYSLNLISSCVCVCDRCIIAGIVLFSLIYNMLGTTMIYDEFVLTRLLEWIDSQQRSNQVLVQGFDDSELKEVLVVLLCVRLIFTKLLLILPQSTQFPQGCFSCYQHNGTNLAFSDGIGSR